MKTSEGGRALIEKYEGLILRAYDDYNDKIVPEGQTPKGVLTIGYGHTTSAGAPIVYIGQQITAAEADRILSEDLGKVEVQVNSSVRVPITQNQFDALVSFEFNTGALKRSTLLVKLNNKDYEGAADQFLVWNKAGGRVLEGLERRREAERALFLSPDGAHIQPSIFGTLINIFTSLFKKGN